MRKESFNKFALCYNSPYETWGS